MTSCINGLKPFKHISINLDVDIDAKRVIKVFCRDRAFEFTNRLHSKKNGKFDENFSINDSMVSVFDPVLLSLKKKFLKRSSTHY